MFRIPREAGILVSVVPSGPRNYQVERGRSLAVVTNGNKVHAAFFSCRLKGGAVFVTASGAVPNPIMTLAKRSSTAIWSPSSVPVHWRVGLNALACAGQLPSQ